jgi:hypothetical protein
MNGLLPKKIKNEAPFLTCFADTQYKKKDRLSSQTSGFYMVSHPRLERGTP